MATTLETSWKNCMPSELKLRRYLTAGVGAVFFIGPTVISTRALHHLRFCSQPFSCAQLFTVPCCLLSEPWKSPSSCVSTTSSFGESVAQNMWIFLMELLFHMQVVVLSNSLSMKLTWLRSHFLVILLLIYPVTQGRCSRFCMTLHRGPLPAVGVFSWLGTMTTLVTPTGYNAKQTG